MRRSLVLIPAAIACLLAALVGCAWLSLRHNVTPAAMEKVKPGMTRAEVESILGPPGHYYRWRSHIVMRAPDDSSEWVADDFAIRVHYDATDRVGEVIDATSAMMLIGKGFYINGKNHMPEFMRHWLGWEPNWFEF